MPLYGSVPALGGADPGADPAVDGLAGLCRLRADQDARQVRQSPREEERRLQRGLRSAFADAPRSDSSGCTRLRSGEVWGVGRNSLAKRLQAMDILHRARAAKCVAGEIRARFGVVLERTVHELRGLSCLSLEEVAPPRQQIRVSRSFGGPSNPCGTARGGVLLSCPGGGESCASKARWRQRCTCSCRPIASGPTSRNNCAGSWCRSRAERRHGGADPGRAGGLAGDLQARISLPESRHPA
jgi:hypothetical protein